MHFRIQGLPAEPFAPLFAMPDWALKKHGAVRTIAEGPSPCRISLTDAKPGDELILVNYEHHAVDSPYRMRFAVYVRADEETFDAVDTVRGAVAHAHACGARLRRRRHDDRLGIDRGRQTRSGDRNAICQSAHGLSACAFRCARLLRRAHRAGVSIRPPAKAGEGTTRRVVEGASNSTLRCRRRNDRRGPRPFHRAPRGPPSPLPRGRMDLLTSATTPVRSNPG